MAEMISKQHLLEQIDTTGKGCEYEGKEFLAYQEAKKNCPGTGNTSRHIRKSARKKLLAPRRGRASNSGPRK